jgi:hypothetical protein
MTTIPIIIMMTSGRTLKLAAREEGGEILLPDLCVDMRTAAGSAVGSPLFLAGDVSCWRGTAGSTNGCIGELETERCISCEVGGAAGDTGVRELGSPGIGGPPVIGARAKSSAGGVIIIVFSVEISCAGALFCGNGFLLLPPGSVGGMVGGLAFDVLDRASPQRGQYAAFGASAVLHRGQ